MSLRNLTLRTRIYLSMLAMILVSFLVTGFVTIYDHFEQTERYNQQRLVRKEEAVRKSMEHFLNERGGFIPADSIREAFTDKICELAEVHDLFIALYDLRGRYLISSSSEAMDSLGVPYTLSYSVRKQLITGNPRAVGESYSPVIDSTYQKQSHLLAYWYFNDALGRPLCITNVAYEKTAMERQDLMMLLRELGGSYLVLFLLAALVAYFLSRYITRSLYTIGARFKNVKVGASNEPIAWHSTDEIGQLVSDYNRMLAELEASARQLAQRERESAWREMARQVAHEIKNPLTPMKLRVQHLERSWADDPAHFNERLTAFTQSMTEQIDALSRIATEFAHFAKMPQPKITDLDLKQLIKDTVELFSISAGMSIMWRSYGSGQFVVKADHDQVLRALNNLLTNAIQSIPPDRPGRIDVALRAGRQWLLVRVSDNGSGISEERKPRIFTPNFTTKGTGTGLGLAMVRSMMQQNNARTWFWSREGVGSSFYIAFPVV